MLLEGTQRESGERRASQVVAVPNPSDRAMGERLMCQACDTLQELCGEPTVRERVCRDGAASKALKLLDNHSHSELTTFFSLVFRLPLSLVVRVACCVCSALEIHRFL